VLLVPTLHPAFILRGSDSDRDDGRFAHVIVGDLKKAWTLRKRKPTWDESAIFKRGPDGSWPAIFPTLEDVREFVRDTIGTKVAVDVETTGNTPVDCRLICIGLASENGRVLCFPILRQGGAKYWDPAEWPDALEAITYLLEDQSTPKVFHNGPFDIVVLRCFGIDVGPWGDDTMLAHHCVDAEMPHKLAFLASTRLETRFWKDEVKGDVAWLNLPDERLRIYNLRDCLTTIRCLPSLLEEIKRWGLEALYREEIEIALIMMEATIDGVEVDMLERWVLYFRFEEEFQKAYKDLCELSGDPEFKLSGPRVTKFLYETLGFRIERRTETINPFTGLGNPATDKKALAICALQASTKKQEDGLIALARARKFDKLKGTYTGDIRPAKEVWENILLLAGLIGDQLPPVGAQTVPTEGERLGLRTLFHPEDGTYRIHTVWKNLTVTGRLASSPNLQNLKDTVKGMLKARDGYEWVVVDLSRAELRVIAYFGEDRELLRMFEEDLNLHTINVALMLGIRSSSFDMDPQTEAYLREMCPKLIGVEYESLPVMGGEFADECAEYVKKNVKPEKWPAHLKEIADRWEMTRRLAKEVVFGSNYKGTAVTLYETMKAKRDPKTDKVLFPDTKLKHVEAAQHQWINLHPPISRYWDRIVRLAKHQGYLRSPLSKRIKRFRAGIKESEAINWPIQEFVAAKMNKAVPKIDRRLKVEAPGAMLKIQIHDALYVEAPKPLVPVVKKIYKEELDAPFRFEPFAGLVYDDAVLPGDKAKTGTHLDRLRK
jgi:DNA polymerase I-like protein with 3'-5' exonuclease and polymerase domains